jgi:hypothetical protein
VEFTDLAVAAVGMLIGSLIFHITYLKREFNKNKETIEKGIEKILSQKLTKRNSQSIKKNMENHYNAKFELRKITLYNCISKLVYVVGLVLCIFTAISLTCCIPNYKTVDIIDCSKLMWKSNNAWLRTFAILFIFSLFIALFSLFNMLALELMLYTHTKKI